MNKDFLEMINFPYNTVRKGQDIFLEKVYSSVENKKNLIIQAPTGLGKTVSALAPAIKLGKEKSKTVICLTSRQTQANQVIKTIKDISNKSKEPLSYVAFIGKRNMCYHEDRDLHPATDFQDFCRKTRETGKCSYYRNVRNSDFEKEMKEIIDVSSKNFMSVEEFVNLAGSSIPSRDEHGNRANNCGFCPYELAAIKAYQSDVIICDYNYLFAQGMQEAFLGKIGRELSDCIIIVDEAHNLPDRIRMSYSYSLTDELIRNAAKELSDFVKDKKYDKYIIELRNTIREIFFAKLDSGKDSFLISRDDFSNEYLKRVHENSLLSIVDILRDIELKVKEDRIISYLGRVATFLERWRKLDEESFLRTIEKEVKTDKTTLSLEISCIDPSELGADVLNKSHCSILMSGTLSPTDMYKDILGINNAEILELDSPFEKENQLTLVVDDITTKYTMRTASMYKKIGESIKTVLNTANRKNAIVFFPSYSFMDEVLKNMNLIMFERRVLKEQKFMTKEDKEKFVAEFKSNGMHNRAKVLFAITSGSFAEGLDLPEDSLEMVIVVGLPLAVPDIFTQSVINHFEKKFRKGELYGYVYPAMNKIIQAAGRCIRTETDRGVVVLMDNRFLWPKYALAFPKHWHMKSVENYSKEIEDFFWENL